MSKSVRPSAPDRKRVRKGAGGGDMTRRRADVLRRESIDLTQALLRLSTRAMS